MSIKNNNIIYSVSTNMFSKIVDLRKEIFKKAFSAN